MYNTNLSKVMPDFPSNHHCPVCGKSYAIGYCPTDQVICYGENGSHKTKPWVKTAEEICQRCQNAIDAKERAEKE